MEYHENKCSRIHTQNIFCELAKINPHENFHTFKEYRKLITKQIWETISQKKCKKQNKNKTNSQTYLYELDHVFGFSVERIHKRRQSYTTRPIQLPSLPSADGEVLNQDRIMISTWAALLPVSKRWRDRIRSRSVWCPEKWLTINKSIFRFSAYFSNNHQMYLTFH